MSQTIKTIFCLIERPNGTTYEQEVDVEDNDIVAAMRACQKSLGSPYGYYRKHGQLCHYIRKDAYLVIDYRLGKVQ